MAYTTYVSDKDRWIFESDVNFKSIYVDGLSGVDGHIYLNGQDIFVFVTSALEVAQDVFSTVSANSADWVKVGEISSLSSDIYALSAQLDDVYTTVYLNSAIWNLTGGGSVDLTEVAAMSGYWNETYATVSANSAVWNLTASDIDLSLVEAASGNWNNTFTVVDTNSAKWDETYTTVQDNSAVWNITGSQVDLSEIEATSGNWNSVFTTVSTNSGAWQDASTVVQGGSADWDGVYTVVGANSGFWNDDHTVVANTSANWNSVYTTVNSNSGIIFSDIDHLSGHIDTNTANITSLSSGKQDTLTFLYSLSSAGNNVTLFNDVSTPGSMMFYGTDTTGVRGYYSLVNNISSTGSMYLSAIGPELRLIDTASDYGRLIRTSTSNRFAMYNRVLSIPSPTLTWTKTNNVSFGATNTTSTNGRIPYGTAGRGDASGPYWAKASVIKDDSTYKMWYVAVDVSNVSRIYYATSPDGLTWTKYDNTIEAPSDTTGTNGRIPLGTTGKGDVLGALWCSVIKDGLTYKMWYSGLNSNNVYYQIYYATSPDGLTWTKYNNTVPVADQITGTDGRIPMGVLGSGRGDVAGTHSPSVIKDGDTYKMWYVGMDVSGVGRGYYATSPDGLTWTKYDNTIPGANNTFGTNGRIPLGTGSFGTVFDSQQILSVSVFKDTDGIYRMFYGGKSGSPDANARFVGYAYSSDGLYWTKYDNTIPTASNTTGTNGRIPLGTGTVTDGYYVFGGSVLVDGSVYKMWYSGNGTGNPQICLATMPTQVASVAEELVLKSENGVLGGETGINTLGSINARTVIDGGSIRLNINNVEEGQIDSTGLFSYNNPIKITGTTDAVQGKIIANATQTNDIFQVLASNGTTEYIAVDGTGNLVFTGTNIITDTTTGTKFGTASAQKIGFYNATPVIQRTTTGTTTGFTAGVGTAVLSDSTFTGNSGTKAYTIGDIVLALKQLGLLQS